MRTAFFAIHLAFGLQLALAPVVSASQAEAAVRAQSSGRSAYQAGSILAESVLYVALDGSDTTGDGSPEKPYRTLQKASSVAGPGTTVYVRGGVYNASKERIVSTGEPGAAITYRPSPGDTVILDGAGAVSGLNDSVISITASRHVVFEGFEVRNSAGRGISVSDSQFVTIRDTKVHDVQGRGIGANGEDITIERNEVWNACLVNEDEAMGGQGGWPAAISTWTRPDGSMSRNVVFRGNHVHDVWGEGIIALFVDGALLASNIVHDTYSVLVYIDTSRNVRVDANLLYVTTGRYNRGGQAYPAGGISMATEGYGTSPDIALEHITLSNNLILGTGRGVSYWNDSNNVRASNTYRDVRVVYNVVLGAHDTVLRFASVPSERETPSGGLVQNNVIYAGANGKTLELGNPSAWTFRHNNWPGGVPPAVSGEGNFAADPGFVDPLMGPPAEGYRLRVGSSGIRAGQPLSDVTTDFWGVQRDASAPSIGIHEYEEQLTTFADVPFSHPYHDEIETLYQAGYTAGCATDPLRYCPEQTMNRAESAVFVERGVHSATYDPPDPTAQVFADLTLDTWAARWVNGLWQDQYTAGCGTNPLAYCPWQGHTRAEGCVFYLRMMNGPRYEPPQPAVQTFGDVPLDAWYAKWVDAAYEAGLITGCQETPDLRFCPNDPLTRAMAAHMVVQAKGLR